MIPQLCVTWYAALESIIQRRVSRVNNKTGRLISNFDIAQSYLPLHASDCAVIPLYRCFSRQKTSLIHVCLKSNSKNLRDSRKGTCATWHSSKSNEEKLVRTMVTSPRCCFRFCLPVSEPLIVYSALAAAEETLHMHSGKFHYLTCQMQTGIPTGKHWPMEDGGSRQIKSLSISPSLSILGHGVSL